MILLAQESKQAVEQVTRYLNLGEDDKAIYTLDLLNQMLDSFEAGEPKPWSDYRASLQFGKNAGGRVPSTLNADHTVKVPETPPTPHGKKGRKGFLKKGR